MNLMDSYHITEVQKSQHIKSDDSPRKKKMRLKIKKLQAQNKTLRIAVRRLCLEKKKTKKVKIKKDKTYKHLKELGRN